MNKVTVWPLELVWISDDKESETNIVELIGPKKIVCVVHEPHAGDVTFGVCFDSIDCYVDDG